ncbi:hypothetical protein [Pseudofrankia sp. DC12]|uniref:hypothetical protein n=1 Tax=Pseudofrankia sp. DC12 TaxID=683315 RepID=UPI0005F77EBD|nr:hypothetical protein [Pseudofrankia sp. DC12]
MTDERLSGSQLGALLTLMAVDRAVSNPELKERFRLTIDGANRRVLNELKLVESHKFGRAFVHSLTDDGWARCGQELAAPLPESRTFAVPPGAVYALLGGLSRYLGRAGLTLADVFAAQPAPTEGSAPAVAEDLEQTIRVAYRDLAQRPGAWVRLSALRPRLGDTPRQDVDEVLRELNRAPGSGVTIAPEEDQKTLTSSDRAAAVRIGGQDKHLLLIEN